MKKTLDINEFKKTKEYVVCIDSDGTVIDAMNVKHKKCHGPSFIDVWGLDEHREEVQKMWNEINLYSKDRGVNRFIALVKILKKLDGKYLDAKEDVAALEEWMNSTKGLSNKYLKEEIAKTGNETLKKALEWSELLNRRISELTYEDKPPFGGVESALDEIGKIADIAIVSSSNFEAIWSEWDYYGLLKYVDVLTSQEIGTKGQCIARLIALGYDPEKVLMIGDAYPDTDAAVANGVWYYPIMTNKETESWDNLKTKYFKTFTDGNYKDVQAKLITDFEENFKNI